VQWPQPQPPEDDIGFGERLVSDAVPVLAAKENRLRARSLPQFGHATSVRTAELIGRRSSKRCSQDRQMYS
jgi:hypothetical protein